MRGCDRWDAELGAYLDRELEAGRAQALEAHLPDCPDCRGSLHAHQNLDAGLTGLRPIPPGPQFEARFWARLARDRDARESVGWRPRWLPLGLGAAALAAFALYLSVADPALSEQDWQIVAEAERFEILIAEDHELVIALEVIEAWDGSEEI